MTDQPLEHSVRRLVRRLRTDRTTPGAPELGPTSTYEALLDQRCKDLAAEVAEIKGRVNGLIFIVAGGVITDLVIRLIG